VDVVLCASCKSNDYGVTLYTMWIRLCLMALCSACILACVSVYVVNISYLDKTNLLRDVTILLRARDSVTVTTESLTNTCA